MSAEKMNNQNAVIYIRISTDREEQQTSLRNQEELCREIIEDNGWSFNKIYVDILSGRIRKRPQFEELLRDMETGSIQYVVVKEASRLFRNVTSTETIREIANKNNIHLISVDGEMDTEKKGYECLTQVGADAQKESEKISIRTKNSIRMQAKRGEFIGSIAPLGYYLEDKTLYVRNDETVKIVKRIFNSYLNGKGAKSIAKELQLENIPTPSMVAGKQNATANWNDTTIYKILKNEVYIGNLVQLVEESYISREELKRKKRNASEIVRREGTHEPIISNEIFEAARELRISKPQKGEKGQDHLFSNILFCMDCESRMTFKSNWNGGSYVCGNYLKKGKEACSNHAISERYVVDQVSHSLRSHNNVLDFNKYTQKIELKINQLKRKMKGRMNALCIEINDIDEKIDKSFEKYIDDKVSEQAHEHFTAKQKKLKEKKQLEFNKLNAHLEIVEHPDTTKAIKEKVYDTYHFRKIEQLTINMFVEKVLVSEDKQLEMHFRFNRNIT